MAVAPSLSSCNEGKPESEANLAGFIVLQNIQSTLVFQSLRKEEKLKKKKIATQEKSVLVSSHIHIISMKRTFGNMINTIESTEGGRLVQI